MARDDWDERLEAWLDGELPPAAATAFAAETAADPELQSVLAERRAFREQVRRALADDVPPALTELRRAHRRARRNWPALALAATLVLAFLVPALLRNEEGAEGPRSTITRSGQVAVVRFGEQPGGTVTLEPGWYDQQSDPAH